MELKNYTVACHACRKIHSVEAYFISTPFQIQVEAGGPSYPAWACPECQATPGAVEAAYDRIMRGNRRPRPEVSA